MMAENTGAVKRAGELGSWIEWERSACVGLVEDMQRE